MFGELSGCFSMVLLALSVIAFIVALNASSKAKIAHEKAEQLEARLKRLELQTQLGQAPVSAPTVVAAPEIPVEKVRVETTPEPEAVAAVAAPIAEFVAEPIAPDVAAPIAETIAASVAEPVATPEPTPVITPAATPAQPATPPAQTTPPKSKISLEEFLSTRTFIWIGAIALVLAVIYFLRYSVQQGWASPLLHFFALPSVRVAIVVLFGALLLGASEWMRRRPDQVGVRIGQGLAGAGILALYGAIFASVKMYEIMPAGAGFVAMALVTAGAVLLALRHGAPCAIMGLVGGMAMPLLLSNGQGQVGPLVAYLLLLQVGVMLVARQRNWAWLPLLTLVGSLIWQALLTFHTFESIEPHTRLFVSLFTLGSAVMFILFHEKEGAAPSKLLPWTYAALGAALLMTSLQAHPHDALGMSTLGLASLGLLVLTWLKSNYHKLLPIALGFGFLVLLSWNHSTPAPTLPSDLALALLIFGALWGMGGALLAWRHHAMRAFSVSVSIAGPLLALALAFAWLPEHAFEGHAPWSAGICVGVAAFMALCAWLVMPRAETDKRGAQQAYVLTTAALLSLAALLAVAHPWTASAFAGLALAATLILMRWLVPRLAWIIVGFAGLALGILGFHSEGSPARDAPMLGHALLEWGIPALLCAAAMALLWARLYMKRDPQTQRLVFEIYNGALLQNKELDLVKWASDRDPLNIGIVLSVILASAGLYSGLRHPWEATGLALLVVVIAYGARLFRSSLLPVLGAGLAVFVAAALALRGVWGLSLASYQIALAYALPVLLLGFAAWKTRHDGKDSASKVVAALTVLSMSAGLFFFILNVCEGADLPRPNLGTWVALFVGQGLLALALIGEEIIHIMRGKLFQKYTGIFSGFSPFVLGFAALLWLAGCLLISNPLWSRETLGAWPVLNFLLPAYFLPAAIMLYLAAKSKTSSAWQIVLSTVGMLSLLLFVSLSVRHAFHGHAGEMDVRLSLAFSQAEHYALSASWGVLGALLLATGIYTRVPLLRHGALAVLLIATSKVFLFDMRHSEGLWKVASFLGLGITLMGLGYVWQRFVFSKKEDVAIQD